MDERRIGKHLAQCGETGRVRRRFQDKTRRDTAVALHPVKRHRLQERDEHRPPFRALARRELIEAQERRGALPVIGKGELLIGRRHAHVQERELVLLRVQPAHLHIVHRPRAGDEIVEPGEDARGQVEVARVETFIRRGRGKRGIARQQLVKESGARPPMADDEDRRFELHPGDPAPIEEVLERVQGGIHERKEHRRYDDVDAPGGGRNGEAVLREKREQCRHVHAVPDAADPPRIAVVRRTHSPIPKPAVDFGGRKLAPHPPLL